MRPVLLLALLLAAEPAAAQRLEDEVAEEVPEAPDDHPAWRQYALLDRLEWSPQSCLDPFSADASALIGGERDRVWIAAVADGNLHPRLEYLELQALYSRNFAGDWDVQARMRWDALPHPDRFYCTAGIQGDATTRSGSAPSPTSATRASPPAASSASTISISPARSSSSPAPNWTPTPKTSPNSAGAAASPTPKRACASAGSRAPSSRLT